MASARSPEMNRILAIFRVCADSKTVVRVQIRLVTDEKYLSS